MNKHCFGAAHVCFGAFQHFGNVVVFANNQTRIDQCVFQSEHDIIIGLVCDLVYNGVIGMGCAGYNTARS